MARASCTLKWDVLNATSVEILPEIGSVPSAGTRKVTVTETTTFTLRARGQGRPETGRATVYVCRKSDDAAKPDLSPAKRQNNYGLSFTGYLQVPTTGVYTLYTTSDDGSALFIGDTLVVDNGGAHKPAEQPGKIALMAGKHAVRIPFMQGGGGAALNMSYAGPGLEKQIIPASAWSHVSRGR